MKSQLKEEYVIDNIVVGQKVTPVDIIVKLNLNINVKTEYVSWGICKWLGTESCKSFRNKLCVKEFLTNPMFSVIYLIFERKISCKTSIQKIIV